MIIRTVTPLYLLLLANLTTRNILLNNMTVPHLYANEFPKQPSLIQTDLLKVPEPDHT